MNKSKGNFWVWFLTLPLLAFSAYRNLDLILTTMGGDAGSVVAGIGALFALDLGVLLWLAAFNSGRGNQRAVAGVMVVIDLIGAASGLLADTLLRGGGQDALEFVRLVATWAIPIVIGLNFAAGVMYFMFDPDRAIADAEREVSEALEFHLAEALKANSKQAAAGAVEPVLQNRLAELVAAFGARSSQSQGKPSSNGHSESVALNADGAEVPAGVSKSGARKR